MTQEQNLPEQQLKELILQQYRSVRAFCNTFQIPYSTMNNVFLRGISSVNLSTAGQLCAALELDLAAFGQGSIRPAQASGGAGNPGEQSLLESYRELDSYGQELVELVAQKEQERCLAAKVVRLPGGEGWRQYVGKPIACRGGGVTPATEEDARQMERIYSRLLDKP